MHRTLVALTLAALFTTGANPQALVTGHDMVLPCAQALTGAGDNSLDWMPMGFCLGVISGLARAAPHLETRSRFCVPADAARDEQLAAVVQYLENHAERLQEDFHGLAFEALRATWPCAKPPPGAPAVQAPPSSAIVGAAPAAATAEPEQSGSSVEKARPATGKERAKKRTARATPQRSGARQKSRQLTSLSPFEMFVFGLVPTKRGWRP